ncbi:hypothetical protein SA59458_18160 [Staphylococcus aureus]|uniref:hypothetical protein n=1 Tax=Staphylococcus aureus TaxID=1280 RepID=UPI00218B30A4|nr:hypothetical protein [Staphylococcus aureus]BCX98758.1 hypothetical protein SA59458_18160 [Staphylococcus aureus]HDA4299034.1 hypothetical protein [Staphylococcus aureus]HDC9011105.1 hypothetical protein [Staphylococcus aureus]HDF1808390.1 hypothetical protein [Staphylococcus aureus]HDG8787632.1 hypothetical protein [Staphylococcus aureus]
MKKLALAMKKSMRIEFFIAIFLKEQEVKNWKTVDQIIKNEHLVKSDYEAEPPLFLFSGSLD